MNELNEKNEKKNKIQQINDKLRDLTPLKPENIINKTDK
jgi:hypothetical protein